MMLFPQLDVGCQPVQRRLQQKDKWTTTAPKDSAKLHGLALNRRWFWAQ